MAPFNSAYREKSTFNDGDPILVVCTLMLQLTKCRLSLVSGCGQVQANKFWRGSSTDHYFHPFLLQNIERDRSYLRTITGFHS